MLLDFVRWDMTVSLQKLMACGAEIFYFVGVPGDGFGDGFRALISFNLRVCSGRGRRHCILNGYASDVGKEEGRREERECEREYNRRPCVNNRSWRYRAQQYSRNTCTATSVYTVMVTLMQAVCVRSSFNRGLPISAFPIQRTQAVTHAESL